MNCHHTIPVKECEICMTCEFCNIPGRVNCGCFSLKEEEE